MVKRQKTGKEHDSNESLQRGEEASTSTSHPQINSEKNSEKNGVNMVCLEGEEKAKEEEKVKNVKEKDNVRPIVFIWDLDETLIIFQSLINGKFAQLHGLKKEMQTGFYLGRRWETLILNLCDDRFFFKQMEDLDQPNACHLSKYDDGKDLNLHDFDSDHLNNDKNDANIKNNHNNHNNDNNNIDDDGEDRNMLRLIAYRYRKIMQLYYQGGENLLKELNLMNEWKNIYSETDQFTDGWLSSGVNILKQLETTNFDYRFHPIHNTNCQEKSKVKKEKEEENAGKGKEETKEEEEKKLSNQNQNLKQDQNENENQKQNDVQFAQSGKAAMLRVDPVQI